MQLVSFSEPPELSERGSGMIFGGLQTCSLIDFPGRISCVLFLSGCNFRCPYCHNPELARGCPPGNAGFDFETFERFLKAREGLLDGVVLCGGEPTVQPGIEELCLRIKSMGYPVKLDTNGGVPGVLARLIRERAVDYIAMDIKTDPDLYSRYLGSDTGGDAVSESIPIVMGSGVGYEFRTTCARPMVGGEVIEKIARLIEGAGLYVLQKAKECRSLDPFFFRGKGGCIDDSGMLELKKIAVPFVERCVIR